MLLSIFSGFIMLFGFMVVWGVGAETFAFDAALEDGGTETDCTSDAAYVYIYSYEEMRGL